MFEVGEFVTPNVNRLKSSNSVVCKDPYARGPITIQHAYDNRLLVNFIFEIVNVENFPESKLENSDGSIILEEGYTKYTMRVQSHKAFTIPSENSKSISYEKNELVGVEYKFKDISIFEGTVPASDKPVVKKPKLDKKLEALVLELQEKLGSQKVIELLSLI